MVVIDPVGGELVIYARYVPATDAIAIGIVSIGFGITPCDCFNLVDVVVANLAIDTIFGFRYQSTEVVIAIGTIGNDSSTVSLFNLDETTVVVGVGKLFVTTYPGFGVDAVEVVVNVSGGAVVSVCG